MTAEWNFPNDENGDVLRRMHRDGDDLTKARDIEFTVGMRFMLPDGSIEEREPREGSVSK
jgi:hypothetical protein